MRGQLAAWAPVECNLELAALLDGLEKDGSISRYKILEGAIIRGFKLELSETIREEIHRSKS
jgi:hypothetical protein